MRPCVTLYEPVNVLKPVADDLWIVDGPEVRMSYFGLRLPFSTRMTVARLPDGRLWIHSPTELTEPLRRQLADLGPVAHLVAPNTLHHVWVPAWAQAYPEASVHVAPGLEARLGPRVPQAVEILGEASPAAWDGTIEQTVASGRILTEVDFFHRPSRTLVLTDLIENFEPCRYCARWRWVVRFSGAADPHGSAPGDMRASFLGKGSTLRAAVRQMLAWEPERVILAHGRWYERDGTRELRRAFRWVRGVGT